jgi:hypothetical protein
LVSVDLLRMSAFDPKRTCAVQLNEPSLNRYDAVSWGPWGSNETARVHHAYRRRGGRTATRRVRAAANAGSRLFQHVERFSLFDHL